MHEGGQSPGKMDDRVQLIDVREVRAQAGLPPLEESTPPLPAHEAPTQTLPKTQTFPAAEGVPQSPFLEEQPEMVLKIPPEVLVHGLEQRAEVDASFHQELLAAKQKLMAEGAELTHTGSPTAPLEGVSFAEAAVLSLLNPAESPVWVKLAGQVVQIEGRERRVTIWRTFADAEQATQAESVDWAGITRLKQQAEIVAGRKDRAAKVEWRLAADLVA